jgi:hypothetical protein
MLPNFENPFADYGGIVTGERFIGRIDDLREVENRVRRPREPGNLAIIGCHGVGKSSLVHKAIIEYKKELLEKRCLPIWIHLPNYRQALMLFRSLVEQCCHEMAALGPVPEPIKSAAVRALEDKLLWHEAYIRIQRFFEKIRQANFRVLFVLDEFDHACTLFNGDIQGFQGLRELSNRPECRVAFVTISRRRLYDIEIQTGAISTLDQIFHPYHLPLFNESEMREYFSRLSSVGINITPLLEQQIRFYCGNYPFLLDRLCYHIVETFREHQGVIDLKKVDKSIEQSFFDFYDHIVDFLKYDRKEDNKEASSLNKMLKILFDLHNDTTRNDTGKYSLYGLIKENGQGKYAAFSGHFQDYLKKLYNEQPPEGPNVPDVLLEGYWNPAERERLARFVIPGASQVGQVLDAVRQATMAGVGIMPTKKLVAAIYEELAQWKITYEWEPYNPEAFEQRVRLPPLMLRSVGPRAATCLETSLLFAACIEAGHGEPLIFRFLQRNIYTHEIEGAHAIVGFWLQPFAKRPQAQRKLLYEDPVVFSIKRPVNVIVLETIGVTKNEYKTYRGSRRAAMAIFTKPGWLLDFAVDIAVARQEGLMPLGQVRR